MSAAPGKPRRKADPELAALKKIIRAFLPFDRETRARMMTFLQSWTTRESSQTTKRKPDEVSRG